MMTLEVRDTEGPVGAEVFGLDPGWPLDADAHAALQDAFDRRSVLVFRDVDIDLQFQARLSRSLIAQDEGSLAEDSQEAPFDWYISNRVPDAAAPFGRLPFHSDSMWCADPYLVLSLYGEEVEVPVAPTFFAGNVTGWEKLPDDLRRRVEGLHARHVSGIIDRSAEPDDDVALPDFGTTLSTVKPIVWSHPRTGRPQLWLCEQMTSEVVELDAGDSEALLGELFAHLYASENRWQHEWQEGDLIVWDNVAVQHSRPNVDEDGPVRTLRKFGTPHPDMTAAQVPTYTRAGT
ncbi:MAG TPA: TauD/TfdA family dioxygenase [Acidimicrobiales bacterium]